MPTIPSINEQISMENLFSGITIDEGSCIPKTPPGFEQGYDTTIVLNIESFCDDIDDIDCLDKINFFTIESGSNNLEIDNQLPIKIDQLDLESK